MVLSDCATEDLSIRTNVALLGLERYTWTKIEVLDSLCRTKETDELTCNVAFVSVNQQNVLAVTAIQISHDGFASLPSCPGYLGMRWVWSRRTRMTPKSPRIVTTWSAVWSFA